MDAHLKIVSFLADLLDRRFSIFGFHVGIDPLLGLIPGVGDGLSLILSFYIVWIATRYGLPTHVIGMMLSNILLDFFIGLIPVVGDAFDFFYQANTKNMALLKRHLKAQKIIEGEIVEG